jgi:hypothetical protein
MTASFGGWSHLVLMSSACLCLCQPQMGKNLPICFCMICLVNLAIPERAGCIETGVNAKILKQTLHWFNTNIWSCYTIFGFTVP